MELELLLIGEGGDFLWMADPEHLGGKELSNQE